MSYLLEWGVDAEVAELLPEGLMSSSALFEQYETIPEATNDAVYLDDAYENLYLIPA